MEEITIIAIYVLGLFFATPLIGVTAITMYEFPKFLICVVFYPLTLLILFGKYFGTIISEQID